jgi:hypothetical protein
LVFTFPQNMTDIGTSALSPIFEHAQQLQTIY